MRVVDGATMAGIDRRSHDEFSIPSLVLMEGAGLRAYLLVKDLLLAGDPVRERCVFLAGKGNNGGDALVMARHAFIDGVQNVTVVLSSPELKADASAELAMVRSLGIPVLSWEDDRTASENALMSARFLFDGLAGTGLSGPLRAPLPDMVSTVNASGAVVVSIDVPSGLYDGYRNGEPAVRADHTVTMGLPKLCMFMPSSRPLCGKIHVVDPGFPPSLLREDDPVVALIEDGDLRRLLPRIGPDAYKNRRGTVAVFAGAPGTTGAAALCSTAALRSRAGLVTLFSDPEAWVPLASKLTSVMVKPLPADADPGMFDFTPYSCLLAGPGWGTSEARIPRLKKLFASNLPGVLDADGIKLLARMRKAGPIDLGGRWILTPHPGEFSELDAVTDREELLSNPIPRLLDAARALNAVIILKGHVSLMASPGGRLRILDGMNPALATGGSGDVLAGMIAGILAGGVSPETAAEAALIVQRRIGARVFRERGWFTADDLLPCISRELAEM